MGIINVTPDSFSGEGMAPGGRSELAIVAAALEQARRFVDAGAEILDVGAESSRPPQFYGEREPVDAAAEIALAVPVVVALARAFAGQATVSIDTTKGQVARAALEAGATMVNDVWAGRRDPATIEAAAEADAHLVLMHNREVAEYPGGVFDEVLAWLRDAIERALAAGVARERLFVDRGIGFGKAGAHSLELLHRLAELKAALGGLPLLVGTSRKRFIGELLGGAPPQQPLEATRATVSLALAGGAHIVRVHDVAPMMKAVRVADGILGWRRPEA